MSNQYAYTIEDLNNSHELIINTIKSINMSRFYKYLLLNDLGIQSEHNSIPNHSITPKLTKSTATATTSYIIYVYGGLLKPTTIYPKFTIALGFFSHTVKEISNQIYHSTELHNDELVRKYIYYWLCLLIEAKNIPEICESHSYLPQTPHLGWLQSQISDKNQTPKYNYRASVYLNQIINTWNKSFSKYNICSIDKAHIKSISRELCYSNKSIERIDLVDFSDSADKNVDITGSYDDYYMTQRKIVSQTKFRRFIKWFRKYVHFDC
jgi:hypothetical protein